MCEEPGLHMTFQFSMENLPNPLSESSASLVEAPHFFRIPC